MNAGHKYYYSLLSEYERCIYDQLFEGLLNHELKIKVNNCTCTKLSEVYEKVILDNPDIYFVKSIKIRVSVPGMGNCVIPSYRFDREQCRAIDDKITEIIAPVIGRIRYLSDFEKEKAIHDFLIDRTEYKDLEAPYSHEMPGAIIYGIGVCEGIAKAFKYMADKVNLNSIVVIGEADGIGHAWNIVKINGDYYHLDTTYDLGASKQAYMVRYDYFNVSDENMINRSYRKELLPKCNQEFGFYYKQGLYAKSFSELKRIIGGSKNKIITVQLPVIECENDELLNHIIVACNENVRAREYEIIPNFEMYIFTIKLK